MINSLCQHVPDIAVAGPVVERLVATFETKDDLKDISFVKRWMDDPKFYQLSICRYDGSKDLMVELDEGKWWWVVGYLEHDVPELPSWKPPKPISAPDHANILDPSTR